jgi:hypothetical protein
MEDLVRYLDEIVEPTVKDFEANPTSVRHASLACVVVFHAVDYRAYPRKARQTREKYAGGYPKTLHLWIRLHTRSNTWLPALVAHQIV